MKNKEYSKISTLKNSIKITMLFAYLLGSTSYLHAAGLGYLNIKSTLDKPLIAEVEVIGSIEPNTVAEIATAEEYTKDHLEYNADLAEAELKIVKQKNKYIILITTKNNFNEPVINLLLKLSYNGQSIKKGYTKFIELNPASDINTARVVDNNINPTADLINPTNSGNITTNTNTDNYSDIQITNNKKVILNKTIPNNIDDTNASYASSELKEPIQYSGTIYVDKQPTNQQVNVKENKSKPEKLNINKKEPQIEALKQIEISIQKSAKLDVIPLSTNNKENKPAKQEQGIKKEEIKKEPEKKNIPDIKQKTENKPTLKLDSSPSAVDLFNKTISERQISNSVSNTDLGIGLGNINNPINASSANTNASMPAISQASQATQATDKNASSVVASSTNINVNDKQNKENKKNNIGIFEVIKANIITSSNQPWFYIIILAVSLLSAALGYIIYLKKQFAKSLIKTKEQLNILEQQVTAYTQYKEENDADLFKDEDDTNDKKRKRKRKFTS